MNLYKSAILLLLVCMCNVGMAQTRLQKFNNHAQTFFGKYVANGLVDYKTVKQNPDALNNLVTEIKFVSINNYSATRKKSFYINAYNVAVIWNVIQHYPIASPMDVKDFFDEKIITIGGENLSLNDIENKKIRPVYLDARIHFALVCAAMGCPKITDKAIMYTTIDAQLNMLTTSAINDATFIRVDNEKQTVLISEIFKWYDKDFTYNGNSILAYINQYRNTKIPEGYKIDYYKYDWQLNEKR